MLKHTIVTSMTMLGLLGLSMSASGLQNYDPPPPFPPDANTAKQIHTKTEELRALYAKLPSSTPVDVKADVEIYLKAAEWIVRHNEFYVKDAPKQTLTVLDAGIARAKSAAAGKTPWREIRNKPVARGYRSVVDGSVHPYIVTIPDSYGKGQPMRLDVVLHGRDATITEVKYLNRCEVAKAGAKGSDYIVLEPYGRGNNAYRWAGETDVKEAVANFVALENKASPHIDMKRTVLRGFSMGGAGSWHLGLHDPFAWNVVGPGAGFSVTRGYIKNLPNPLPDYQERCLHIYDAVDYAENVFDVPVVAYSGSNDPQKAAADNIVNALKDFKEPYNLTHLVAPGLEHKMPPEWLAKAETEYQKYVNKPRTLPETVRFVTYTTQYGNFGYGQITGLDEHYRKSIITVKKQGDALNISTTNIRSLALATAHAKVTIDGTTLNAPGTKTITKMNGKWTTELSTKLTKNQLVHGPIDDAFRGTFRVLRPAKQDSITPAALSIHAALKRFDHEWDRYFRGSLQAPVTTENHGHIVLFGTPATNATLAKVLPDLPIKWTEEKLTVNGIDYDAKTHYPVLIYPNPLKPGTYVVLNTGHTFHEADLKGTNALLYPRLGDWAVLKSAPTAKDPAATEVVAAGIFDEFWQFKK